MHNVAQTYSEGTKLVRICTPVSFYVPRKTMHVGIRTTAQ
jgi:hypothetical protein